MRPLIFLKPAGGYIGNCCLLPPDKVDRLSAAVSSGGRGRNRTLSDAVLETAALPVSYTPDIWHRLPVTIQRLCGHNAALCH